MHVCHTISSSWRIRCLVQNPETLVHAERGDRVLVVLPREVVPLRGPLAPAGAREHQVIRHGGVRVPVLLAAERDRESVAAGHRAPVRADPGLVQLLVREPREALDVRGLLELREHALEHLDARGAVRPLPARGG